MDRYHPAVHSRGLLAFPLGYQVVEDNVISTENYIRHDSDKIAKLFEKHFKKIAPKAVKVKVTALHGGEGVVTPTNSVAYLAASKAMQETFGKKPIPVRTGGSIPIVALFEKELGLKTVLMGFGLDSDNIHSPDEHYGVFNFFKGIETIPLFFRYYAEGMK